ncbi:MAG: ATP-binding protein [Proteobacteria bacterium]|nr:ATP-binding protein [Pseudomonadota bacterium]
MLQRSISAQRAWCRLLFVFSTCLVVAGSVSALAQDSVSAQKILVIHDSSDLGFWRQSFDSSLHSYISENTRPNKPMRLSIEYTGINQQPESQRPDALIAFLKEQHALDPAHLIVSVLPPSAQFVNTYGDEIFPGVPRIYLAPAFSPAIANESGNNENVYLFEGNLDAMTRENLRLIPQVYPRLANLLILSGSGSYGGVQARQMRDALDEIDIDVSVEFVTGLPINELSEQLQAAPPGTAAVLLSYEIDAQGNVFSTQDVLNEITSKTTIPVFGVFDSVYGRGIVGGYMSRASFTAGRVGAIVLAMLNDEPIPAPVAPYDYLFDGSELDRVGIDRDLLPAGSIIEFEAFSLWRTYQSQIITGIIVILIQALLILALFVSLRRQRAVESELKEQAQDLSVQKNLFESVINSIPDAIVITRMDRTISAVNKSSKDIFGLESAELIGMNASELAQFKDMEQRIQLQTMLDSPGDPDPMILQFNKGNGETFSGETIGTKIISAEGEELGYFSLVRDITRRLVEEQEQQQSQKMQALGTMVGGIAHDFNNVLGVISAYAELLGFDAETEEGRTNIGKIVKATQRGADLCNQIMSFSRDMSVEQQQLNLLDVVKESVRLLSATIPSKIQLRLESYGDEFSVFANFTQLQQVILNLATNANHAIGESAGEICISLSLESLNEKRFFSQGWIEAGDYVVLRVADTGCGIKSEDLNRIFDPFFTTRKKAGTGMGLAMVYKIVRAHNGTINLNSKINSGTQIDIYLPRSKVEALFNPELLDPELVKGDGQHILLVDDEEELLNSVRGLLVNIGYSVEAYSDAFEALDAFRLLPGGYDLLISDQVMPGMNGTVLMQKLRELRENLPVIICTGHSEVLDKDYEFESEINSVMRKPFTAIELSHSIDQALSVSV